MTSGTGAVGRERLVVCALLAAPVVALSVVPALQFAHWAWICLVAAAPVVVWGALPLHRGTARALRRGAIGDDVPVVLGTAGAAVWSVVALLLGPAGDPGWTQPFPPIADPPPVRLDVAAGITLAFLVAAHLRTAVAAPLRPGPAVVPVVLTVAAGTVGYRLGAGDAAVDAATTALAVLLVAAPSAFRSRPGGAEPVERRVDTVLFTPGTLAGGPRRLDDVRTADGTGRDEALRMAGSLAEPSTHPVAMAIADAAAGRGELPAVAEFDERPGLGASGIVAELHPDDGGPVPDLGAVAGPAGRRADGTAVTVVAHAVLLGHPDLLAEHDVTLPPDLRTACAEFEAAGHTAVALAWDGRARAVLAVATDVDPDAVAAVRAVRRSGMVPALLSVRPAVAATALAERAGIDPDPDPVPAGADSEADAVARLRADGHLVAVVGRAGRDDGPLGAADLALAVAAGDGVHGHAGPSAAVTALRRRRRRPGPAQWTVAAGVAYHLLALPVAASGMIDPLLAGLAGALVTVAFSGQPMVVRVQGGRRRGRRPPVGHPTPGDARSRHTS